LWVSQVAPGNENGLQLRVYGTKGGLSWRQDNPNHLLWTPFGQPTQIVTRGSGAVGEAGARVTRIPPGHPEGYLEAFATLYTEAASAIAALREGQPVPSDVTFPGIDDGFNGIAFVDAALRSSAAGGVWTEIPEN
jgi:predicted dehydrogenase